MATSSGMQRRDKLIPLYFVAFFAVVALVDGVMATLAIRTQTGLVTDHAYEKGIAYNQLIAAEEKQEALGWKSTLRMENGKLIFNLKDAQGNALLPERAQAHFMRPTQANMDFEVSLQGAATPVAFPAKGLWDVRVYATMRGVTYQQTQRLVVE